MNMTIIVILLIVTVLTGTSEVINTDPARRAEKETVSWETMAKIYEEVKTPYKYGVVLKSENGEDFLCPNVFRHGDKWLMVYVSFNGAGYQTHLAESDNLLEWDPFDNILTIPGKGWDKWQASGGVALMDCNWGQSNTLETYKKKYWLSYIGGAREGREPDPLAIGIACTENLEIPGEWTRVEQNPVLSSDDPDVRGFEKMTLYKSHIIWDKYQTLGFPFVMFYNGKIKSGYEKIGMAVSEDMVHWSRFGPGPVITNGEKQGRGISGDPQIVRIGDIWVMFYFGAFWKPKIFDTFACSYDLVHWTKWDGPNLVEPSEPWDRQAAHKPWIIKHEGIVYHFYHAKGDQGQVIGLATSKDLRSFDHNSLTR